MKISTGTAASPLCDGLTLPSGEHPSISEASWA